MKKIVISLSEKSIDKALESQYVATAPKNDYIVKRVAKSLNSIAYAVSKVDVS